LCSIDSGDIDVQKHLYKSPATEVKVIADYYYPALFFLQSGVEKFLAWAVGN